MVIGGYMTAKEIRVLRARARMTIKDLAGLAGITIRRLISLESGEREIKPHEIDLVRYEFKRKGVLGE